MVGTTCSLVPRKSKSIGLTFVWRFRSGDSDLSFVIGIGGNKVLLDIGEPCYKFEVDIGVVVPDMVGLLANWMRGTVDEDLFLADRVV